MKLQMFCATAIAFAVWGCEGLLDEQAGETRDTNDGVADSQASYRVGVKMADNSDILKNVNLKIFYHSDSGIPTGVCVNGFEGPQEARYVKLENRGTGEWRIDPDSIEADGTYDRYQRADNAVPLDITLHWTKKRSDITTNNMGNATGRLERLTASLSNGTSYEYQNDADNKSGLAKGELSDTPTDSLFGDCPS